MRASKINKKYKFEVRNDLPDIAIAPNMILRKALISKHLKSCLTSALYIFLIEICVKIPRHTIPAVKDMLKLIITGNSFRPNNRIPETAMNKAKEIEIFIVFNGFTLAASRTAPSTL